MSYSQHVSLARASAGMQAQSQCSNPCCSYHTMARVLRVPNAAEPGTDIELRCNRAGLYIQGPPAHQVPHETDAEAIGIDCVRQRTSIYTVRVLDILPHPASAIVYAQPWMAKIGEVQAGAELVVYQQATPTITCPVMFVRIALPHN